MRAVLNALVILFAAGVLAMIGILAMGQQRADDHSKPVEVQATVTRATSRPTGSRGSTPVVFFRAGDGRSGHVEGRHAAVGDRITVYRHGSGSYYWAPQTDWFSRSVPWALLALSMFAVLLAINEARKGIRGASTPSPPQLKGQ
ncbi:hypothetical protein [Brachybacterium endophyticum]|uniref:hypothetical protein n=1 Tax=Brachybacterium endophyticum TaxID=2182385 RepID=UPI001057A6A0|nr:hypothetical protein [Brachybacterium endophyticum]